MQPLGQTLLPASPGNGTKTSPDTGSTATECALPGTVGMFCKNARVIASITPTTGPAELLPPVTKKRLVVGSNQTWSEPFTWPYVASTLPLPLFAFGSNRI